MNPRTTVLPLWILMLAFLPGNRLSGAVEEGQAVQVDSSSQEKSTAPPLSSPPLGSFGRELLANFQGMFVRDNLPPLLIGSAATGLSFAADNQVKDYFSQTRRFRELGQVGDIVGNSAVQGAFAGAMLLWSYNTPNEKFRRMGFSLSQGFLINAAWTSGLKVAIPRDRPDQTGPHSMPSGHTSGTMMTATVISHYYPKAAIPAYSIAALVGLSRIESNRHHLSDVVAGATLGFLVGRTVVRGTDAYQPRKVTWMPMILPDPGIGVAVTIRLGE